METGKNRQCLDLAFALDCTASMSSYIQSATQNIRQVVEAIMSAEKADVRLALVEYRDHPPEDISFVTRVHDFTSSVSQMRNWLGECGASGGGDPPEAVADALQQVYKLDWKSEATKVCILIADAPPHGLRGTGDHFPDGCPAGIDPMEVTGRLAQKGVSLYVVGCEPSICQYKDFFMALAYLTGGQYVPLQSANLLPRVITGGVQEELSLQQLMEDVNHDVFEEVSARESEPIPEEELVAKVQQKLRLKRVKAKMLQLNAAELPEPSAEAKKMSSCERIEQVKEIQATLEQSDEHLCLKLAAPSRMPRSEGHILRKVSAPMYKAVPLLPRAVPLEAAAADYDYDDDADDDACYECVEEEVSEYQAERLVQKALRTNNLLSRVTKKY